MSGAARRLPPRVEPGGSPPAEVAPSVGAADAVGGGNRAGVDGAVRTRPAPASEPARLDPLKLVTSIGSPIALATTLLLYFGWVRSQEQARAFGADASVFGMSTQDYVLRSVNVLFFPVILLLLAALLIRRLDRTLRAGPVRPRRLGTIARGLQLSWVVFLPLGLALRAETHRIGDVTLPFWVALAVLGPAYGTVLRRSATGDRKPFSRVAVALVAALITVVLFWQTERLASLGGDVLAQDIKDNLGARLPRIELFSVKDLHLGGQGVVTRKLAGTDGAYAYQYSGLYLLQRSGGKYFLLSGGWAEGQGRLIVLADGDGIRIEFGP